MNANKPNPRLVGRPETWFRKINLTLHWAVPTLTSKVQSLVELKNMELLRDRNFCLDNQLTQQYHESR